MRKNRKQSYATMNPKTKAVDEPCGKIGKESSLAKNVAAVIERKSSGRRWRSAVLVERSMSCSSGGFRGRCQRSPVEKAKRDCETWAEEGRTDREREEGFGEEKRARGRREKRRSCQEFSVTLKSVFVPSDSHGTWRCTPAGMQIANAPSVRRDSFSFHALALAVCVRIQRIE